VCVFAKLMTQIRQPAQVCAHVLLSLSVLFSALPAQPSDLLTTADQVFFTHDNTRVGIEVEFWGLSVEQSAEIVALALNGYVTVREIEKVTTVKEIKPDGTPVFNTAKVKEWVIKNNLIGDVIVKKESNDTSEYEEADPNQLVVELVTAPIRFDQAAALQMAITALKNAGAKGTTSDKAVATQVNTEIGEGRLQQMNPQDTVDLLRSYVRPEHRAQVEKSMNVPAVRRQYLLPFSPGFMSKLLNPDYHPTWRELYDDYIYRQSLELLGDTKAWSLTADEAHKRLLSHADPVVPSVVKLNLLRISSLLMFIYPHDPMSKEYGRRQWAVARPLVEFREWDTDFNVIDPVREALGLINAAKVYHYYDHDHLVAAMSGLSPSLIQMTRMASLRSKVSGKPLIFRYFMGDPNIKHADYARQLKYYKGTVVGFIPARHYGVAPMVIPGESVVMHRRPFHRFSVMGKYNPGLINYNIQQALENKYAEFRFWNDYAPGAMPETRLLSDLLEGTPALKTDGHIDVRAISAALNKTYPQGWVLKGVWDLGSEREIITDKTDIISDVEKYQHSDFDSFKARTERKMAYLNEATPEYLQDQLKTHRGYRGWKISQMLRDAHLAMVQRRVDIAREFRVEAIAGKVLSDGSTVDRWYYTYQEAGRLNEYVAPSAETIKAVEVYAQNLLNTLPANLRGMPMGMDVALLKNGGMVLIESNPGGNSGFLYEEEKASVLALEKRLEAYPEMVKKGEVSQGLSPRAQMNFLRMKFAQWGLDTNASYPDMRFLDDRIEDPEFTAVQVDPSSFAVKSNPIAPSRKGQEETKRPSGCNGLLGAL
jgi:hypothetical protein